MVFIKPSFVTGIGNFATPRAIKEKKLSTTSTVEESLPWPVRVPFGGTGTPRAISPPTMAVFASSSDQPTARRSRLIASGLKPAFKRSVAYT
ncbi:MAG: hypothetical protein A2942_00985 [Candidatus Lloydbacteria bacterium RIFCSPLOWO2_01_FULL_50_20]|uniref:Uncharacterized protein n=1 Tax=Candidatus Lloydbacteria bacterium RIFCSPLOWO2_01_FULL_50_20 TaxID=1798665 RepID=A0A1G2DIC8_9BACT|nr:MAG: hypothetical protein A2942_00985 [Candidatus Lloydbacteria bacterium RIFCSPLOWO2_01_FULL_50_20]